MRSTSNPSTGNYKARLLWNATDPTAEYQDQDENTFREHTARHAGSYLCPGSGTDVGKHRIRLALPDQTVDKQHEATER